MTKETYAQVKGGVDMEHLGEISNAMAIRHISAHGYYDSEEEIVNVARKSMFTHKDLHVRKASPTEGTLPGAVYIILKYRKQKNGLKNS